jgi:hypothetical protein
MNPLEALTARLPSGVTRSTSLIAVGLAVAGSGCLFGAAALGSVLWAVLGVVAFALAAMLWHIAAIASDQRGGAAPGGRHAAGSR